MLRRLHLFLISFLLYSLAFSQEKNEFCNQIKALKNTVEVHHYQPKTVNDSLSSHVFDLFLKGLDEDKRLLTRDDLKTFELDRYELDDYIAHNICFFIEKYTSTLSKRIEASKTIISDLQKETFDYSGKDTLRFKPESTFRYFKNEGAMKRYWSKRMRYNILHTLIENDSIITDIKSNFKFLEAELKPKLIQKEICKLEELQNRLGSIDNLVKEAFLNAYLHYQDPNSSFFNVTEKEMFENSLSNDQYSFGIITAKNDNGDIIIAHIIPGSAAFNDGNFEVNDSIKSLKADSEILETYCVSNNDVLAFTSNQNHNTITFKIKKQNGTIKNIELTKTITKIEENTVSGYVIEKKSKVGYIKIKSFYSNFESPNGLGLANDVAKELYKLQKENIAGLILDLRFNGGGSMKEATDLSGMFINRGPLSILKFNNGETTTIKDLNRGALFSKPIVILVNNYSASASEYFAAAMQDYNRAVVVGSTTHGKASAQVILPLAADKSLGYSKLTVEKFYRVTGQSHQSQGVIPDIPLPSMYEGFKTQERFQAYALQNDSIDGVRKFPKLKTLPLAELSKRSLTRINDNVPFLAIKGLNQLILKNYFQLDSEYLLTIDNVYREMMSYRNQWEMINIPIDAHESDFMVKNSAFTDDVVSYNEDQKTTNKAVLKDIKHDIYIEEAQAILQDLLNLDPLN